MDQIDRALAQRVWQRVQSPHTPEPTDFGPALAQLTNLAAGEAADAVSCLKLSRELGGQGGPLVMMAREDQAHAGCLRGICAMVSGQPAQIPSLPQEPGTHAAVLRRCYTNHLRRIRDYRRLSEDPDFGPAFEKMASEEQTHCKQLLELLGKL